MAHVDELPEPDRRRLAEGATLPDAARTAAMDAINNRRAYAIEYGADADPAQAPNGQPVPSRSTATAGFSWDNGPGFTAKMSDGLAARLDPKHSPTTGREYAGMSLSDMAMESLRAGGAKGALIPNNRAAAVEMAMGAQHTTGDFAGILAGAAQTVVSQCYRAAQPEIVQTSRLLSVPDFRSRTMMRLSSGPTLEKVNEAGEITHGAFEEEGKPPRPSRSMPSCSTCPTRQS